MPEGCSCNIYKRGWFSESTSRDKSHVVLRYRHRTLARVHSQTPRSSRRSLRPSRAKLWKCQRGVVGESRSPTPAERFNPFADRALAGRGRGRSERMKKYKRRKRAPVVGGKKRARDRTAPQPLLSPELAAERKKRNRAARVSPCPSCLHEGGETLALSTGAATWLILPVVICLSQRLSHACLSTGLSKAKPRMAH